VKNEITIIISCKISDVHYKTTRRGSDAVAEPTKHTWPSTVNAGGDLLIFMHFFSYVIRCARARHDNKHIIINCRFYILDVRTRPVHLTPWMDSSRSAVSRIQYFILYSSIQLAIIRSMTTYSFLWYFWVQPRNTNILKINVNSVTYYLTDRWMTAITAVDVIIMINLNEKLFTAY